VSDEFDYHFYAHNLIVRFNFDVKFLKVFQHAGMFTSRCGSKRKFKARLALLFGFLGISRCCEALKVF
jgi:hypothetical protein